MIELIDWKEKMNQTIKAIFFVACMVFSFFLGKGWRPLVEISTNVQSNVEESSHEDVSGKKTNFNPDGSVASVEEYKIDRTNNKKEIVRIKEIVKANPKVLVSWIPSYNFRTDKIGYVDFSASRNVIGGLYVGVGFEQRKTPVVSNGVIDSVDENIIKVPLTYAF